MTEQQPQWITWFFMISAALALMSTLLVAGISTQNTFDHESRPIADITINLNGRVVREHCITCHPQGALPDPNDLSRTTRPHPDISPHLSEKIGCTGCHLGEGMALDQQISHGLPGLGARQVLSGKDTQASCYTCHELMPLAGAEKVWQGYQLFMATGCSTCHHVAGLGRGGYFGPDLSTVGSMLGLDQIQEAIREPRQEPANSIMPRFPLSKNQSRKIAWFLKSRVTDPFFTTPMKIQAGGLRLPDVELAPAGQALPEGELLLYRKQCLACHQYRDQDGRIAPDLTYIGQIRNKDYVARFLANPSYLIPDAHMPRIAMDPQDEQRLLEYLASQAVGPVPLGMGMKMIDAPDKNLYMQLCQRCHAAGGDGRGPIQENLANFPRVFTGNADYFRTRSPRQLVDSVGKGIPGTSMPAYGQLIDQQQIELVLDLIFKAFIGSRRSEWIEPAPLSPTPRELLGEEEQD